MKYVFTIQTRRRSVLKTAANKIGRKKKTIASMSRTEVWDACSNNHPNPRRILATNYASTFGTIHLE
jgi:hypothetical protein